MNLPESLESRRVEVPGGPMHYVASRAPGHGPAVVLVHGVGLSHRYMIPTAERLVDGFHVYVPDQPGFGKSYKPWRVLSLSGLADGIVEWMDAIGLERASFLGNSVGCQVIVELAVRHPQRITRAVLQGPTVDPAARSYTGQFRRWWKNRHLEGRREKGPIVVRDYWECGPWRLIRTFGYAIEQDLAKLLPRVQCPALVVRGERDPIVPQRWAEEVTRLVPRGELLVLEGNVAHTANFEAPEELVRAVTPFLCEEEAAAVSRKAAKPQRAGIKG